MHIKKDGKKRVEQVFSRDQDNVRIVAVMVTDKEVKFLLEPKTIIQPSVAPIVTIDTGRQT